MAIIVQSSTGVTLLGAGPLAPGDLDAALALAPGLVAADGGVRHALAAGLRPQRVIGDMDSLPSEARSALGPEFLHPVSDQDSTDFEKCLRAVSAPFLIAAGFAGGRMDHHAAVLNALVRHPLQRCIVLGAEDICFHCPPELRLDLPEGTPLSLFPMAPLRGHGEGLLWPPGGIDFAPWGRIGTSNRTTTGPVRLVFAEPGMLVYLPRAQLAEAVRALSSVPDPG